MMLLLTIVGTFLLNMLPVSGKGSLQVEVTNVKETRGKIRVGLFRADSGFPDSDKVYWGMGFTPARGKMTVEIPDLPFGDYALAVFHDLNGNGKLDKNLLGVPTEPYGFSGSAKGKWGSPDFEEARFSFSAQGETQRVALSFWEDL